MFQEILLNVHNHHIEKEPLLALLSTESSSESKEGSDGQQMMLELLNKAFSVKAKW